MIREIDLWKLPLDVVFLHKSTLKIADKLSFKDSSPEIAVNYCITVQVSVNHG